MKRNLNPTEQILFRMLRQIRHDRVQHAEAEQRSAGQKQKRHREKVIFLKTKELALEELLEAAGLYGEYQRWSGEK